MKRRTGLILAIFAAGGCLLAACGKTNSDAASTRLDGDWAIHSQVSSSFFADGTPGYWRTESNSTLNSTKIHFDGKGNFTFEAYNGSSSGTYQFNATDSLLTITPDSAAFLNYCYALGTVSFSTGNDTVPATPLIHTPGQLYVDYHSRDSLSLRAAYLNPDSPSADSIVVAITGFIKL